MSKIKYLPLAYVERYENLTDIYCSKGHFDCEPDVLLDMIADEKWGGKVIIQVQIFKDIS